jgi:acyl carrier protein
MTEELVVEGLTAIFREVFDDNAIELRRDLAAKDIEGWDSMTHLRLILSIERRFGVRLPSTKVAALKNVGDMIDLVSHCLNR